MAEQPYERNFVEGSLAGVRVYWPRSSLTFGHRNAIKRLPDGNRISVRALGEYADERRVECFVLGPDYMIDRDDLADALRKPGPFEMVDPWWGTSTVEIEGRVECVQSTKNGGMATFRFTAVKANELDFPIIVLPSAKIKLQAVKFDLAIADSITNKMSFGKFKRLVLSAMGLATVAMTVVNGKVNSALGFASDLSTTIDAFGDQLNTLAQTPQKWVNGMQELWASLFELVLDIRDSAIPFGLDDGAGRFRGDFDPLQVAEDMIVGTQEVDTGIGDLPTEQTVSRDGLLLVANLNAVEFAIKGTALASASKQIAELSPDDVVFAKEFLDQFVSWTEDLAAYEGVTPAEQEALADLKAAMVDYLVTEGLKAPQVTTLRVPEYTPALVLAHRVYQDATRAQDLIRRNAIADPMLFSGDLEVVHG